MQHLFSTCKRLYNSHYNQPMLTVAIQAGGESRRMGRDKALVPFLGELLIVRVMNRLVDIADEVLVTTNRLADYQFLGVPLFADLIPGRGALGGLYTALSYAREPLVAVVACDMPFVNPQLLAMARDRLHATEVDAVIPRTEKGIEPFHAVYRRHTCLPAVKAAIVSGKWRLISWLHRVEVSVLTQEEVLQNDPYQIACWNLNSIEDFRHAEQFIVDVGRLDDYPDVQYS